MSETQAASIDIDETFNQMVTGIEATAAGASPDLQEETQSLTTLPFGIAILQDSVDIHRSLLEGDEFHPQLAARPKSTSTFGKCIMRGGHYVNDSTQDDTE